MDHMFDDLYKAVGCLAALILAIGLVVGFLAGLVLRRL